MMTFRRSIWGALIFLGLIGSNAFAQSDPPAFPDTFPINVWYFDDTNWFSDAGDPPLSQTNLTLVSTWDDNGLQVDATNAAWLSYPLTNADGWPNLYLDDGSLRFWFLPSWVSTNIAGGTGPGVWGRLIDAGQLTSNATYGWWSLYFDPAGCNIYFSAQTNNGIETNYLYVPISWDNSTWHEIELTYSSSNTALYIDGGLATNGPGITVLPPPEALTNGFSIGSDFATGMQQAHGQFDDLWTFSGAENQTNVIADEYASIASVANSSGFNRNNFTGSFASFSGASYSPVYGSNDFWIEASSGANSCECNPEINLVLHGTTNGNFYELLTTTNLASPIIWTVEQGVQGTGSSTATTLSTKDRSCLFVRARTTNLDIITQPLSQEVTLYDNVTFSVTAGAGGPLAYQWSLNGSNIAGATQSSFRLMSVQEGDAGNYAVTVSSGTNSITSSNATLNYDASPAIAAYPLTYNLIPLTGPRQDFIFRGGKTYYVSSPVQLFGHTVIEGGTVIKFDQLYNSTLQVLGSLSCESEPYNPAILTVVDDDTAGDFVYWLSDGEPWTATNGEPFVDLSATICGDISNLMVRFADQGVVAAKHRTDVWDSQFLACNSATVASQGSAEAYHNVLFAGCLTAVQAFTNFSEIDGEQITADVSNFWNGPVAPNRINLTNSILLGALPAGGIVSTQNVALNPPGTPFQTAGFGNYYLTTNALRQSGTTNISPRILAELMGKTTWPAIALPPYFTVSGNLTFFPQAPRYTNGPPDLGYYYDAIDYTVSVLTNQGTINVEPGTVIGVHNAIMPDASVTYAGFQMLQGSGFVSHGSPGKPIILTAERTVQETPQTYYASLEVDFSAWFSTIAFEPTYLPVDTFSTAPNLDFRFCKFYLPGHDYHFWSGYSEYSFDFPASPDSAVFLTMRDCAVHGGHINLGEPLYLVYPEDFVFTNGAVAWTNNLFDGVTINLDPTIYELGVDSNGLNVDLALQVRNNLFRGGDFFHVEPIPATAGNWVLENNLFDKVSIQQDSLDVGLPLDYDYNGYWPLTPMEVPVGGLGGTAFHPTLTGDGAHDQTLSAAPPYQKGTFGNFYLPTNTALFHSGSTTADQLGLYHYTTQTNQLQEASNIVSIGPHYLAANNGIPIDTDGDGIPDYVENWHGDGAYANHTDSETDWQNSNTIAGVFDPTNSIYDLADLDADGVPGTQEKLFGTNPLIPDNPLDLSLLGTNPVSGTIEVPLKISSAITNPGVVLMTVDGNAVDGNVYQTNGTWVAQWDTTQLTNGFHALSFEVPTNQDCDTVQVTTRFVSVQNAISFPNDAPVAGTALFINPQTIYTNGSWAISVYDDQSNLFASLSGQVDANGLFIDPNTGEEGVTVSILDNQGNLLPSQNYTVQMAEFAPSAISPQATNTSIIRVTPLSGNGDWAIAYMPFFAPFTTSLEYQQATMSIAISAVVNNGAPTYDLNSVIDSPLTADGYTPYQITSTSQSWIQLELDLANPQVRNFFYWGHFDGKHIGGTSNPNLSIDIPTLNFLLHNNATTNQHPYRFVFMDGCNTAKNKDLCAAFGIPTKTIPSSNIVAKGLSPCAFVGWRDVKVISAANSIYQPHVGYIIKFWQLWPTTNSATGLPYTLKDALRYADQTNSAGQPSGTFFKNIVIYGCDDLTFQ